MFNVGLIQSDAAVRLYAHLYINGIEEGVITSSDALLLGIKSPNSLTQARRELEELGLITTEKAGKSLLLRLVSTPEKVTVPEPVEHKPTPIQEPEPVRLAEEPTPTLVEDIQILEDESLEAKARRIDVMTDTNLKLREQTKFLREAFCQFFPDKFQKYPLSDKQVESLLAKGDSLDSILAAINYTSERPDIHSPVGFIVSRLERCRGAQQNQPSAPVAPSKWVPSGGFRTEEDAKEYYTHNDPIVKLALQRRKENRKLSTKPMAIHAWLEEKEVRDAISSEQ